MNLKYKRKKITDTTGIHPHNTISIITLNFRLLFIPFNKGISTNEATKFAMAFNMVKVKIVH